MAWGDQAAADIHAALSEAVVYNGAGLTSATIAAIKRNVAAAEFIGEGHTLRQVSFEVRQAALPQAPAKGNTIVHGGITWRVNDITRRDDVGAWELVVDRAP